MDELLTYLKTEITLDGLIGTSLEKMWFYVSEFYKKKYTENSCYFVGIPETPQSMNFVDDTVKVNIWPYILNIPDIYISENEDILYDTRTDSNSSDAAAENTAHILFPYSFYDKEKDIKVHSSIQSIINLFFKTQKAQNDVLHKAANFAILQLVSLARKKSRFYNGTSQTNRLVLNLDYILHNKESKEKTDPEISTVLPENEEFRYSVKYLITEILIFIKKDSLCMYDLYHLLGLRVDNDLHKNFFQSQINYLISLKRVTIFKKGELHRFFSLSRNLSEFETMLRNTHIRIASTFIDSPDMYRFMKVKESFKQSTSVASINHEISFPIDSNIIIENNILSRVDLDLFKSFYAFKRFSSGPILAVSPETIICQLVALSGESGSSIKTIKSFNDSFDSHYVTKILSNYSKSENGIMPWISSALQTVGKESRYIYFSSPEVIEGLLKLLPLIRSTPIDKSLPYPNYLARLMEFFKANRDTAFEKNAFSDFHAGKLKFDSIFPAFQARQDVSDTEIKSNKVKLINFEQQESKGLVNKDNNKDKSILNEANSKGDTVSEIHKLSWVVFDPYYLELYQKSSRRITLTRLIREQAILDLLDIYGIIDTSLVIINQLEEISNFYIDLLRDNRIDFNLHLHSESRSKFKKNKPKSVNKSLLPFDIQTLLKTLNIEKNTHQKICRKTIISIYDQLSDLGYAQSLSVYSESKPFKSSKKNIVSFVNTPESKDKSKQKLILISNSINTDSDKVKKFIQLISDNSVFEYYQRIISKLNLEEEDESEDADISSFPKSIISLSSGNQTVKFDNFIKIPAAIKVKYNYPQAKFFSLQVKVANKPLTSSISTPSKRKASEMALEEGTSSDAIHSSKKYHKDALVPENGVRKQLFSEKTMESEHSNFDLDKSQDNKPVNRASAVKSSPQREELRRLKDIKFEIETILNSLYVKNILTKTKIVHAFLLDNVFESDNINERLFSNGRLLSNYFLYDLPLYIFLQTVKIGKLARVLEDYVSGNCDNEIDPNSFRYCFYYVDSSQSIIFKEEELPWNGLSKVKKISQPSFSFVDRLSVPVSKLPFSVLASILNDQERVATFLHRPISILMRLELLRPIHTKFYVSSESPPFPYESLCFQENEQETLLEKFNILNSSSQAEDKLCNYDMPSQRVSDYYADDKDLTLPDDKLEEDSIQACGPDEKKIDGERVFSNSTGVVYNNWILFRRFSTGYQVMKYAKLRDYRQPSILPSYLPNRNYHLLHNSHFFSFWMDTKAIFLSESDYLPALPDFNHNSSLKKETLSVFNNKEMYPLEEVPITTSIHLHPHDPLYIFFRSQTWSSDIKISKSQKSCLNSFQDLKNSLAPLNEKKKCKEIALESKTGFFQTQMYYYIAHKNLQALVLESNSKTTKSQLEKLKRNRFPVYHLLFKYCNAGNNIYEPKNKRLKLNPQDEKILTVYKEYALQLIFDDYLKIFNFRETRFKSSRLLEKFKNNLFQQHNKSILMKRLLYTRISQEFDFDPSSLPHYPKRFILQQAYLSNYLGQIYEYFTILRHFKKDVIKNFLIDVQKDKYHGNNIISKNFSFEQHKKPEHRDQPQYLSSDSSNPNNSKDSELGLLNSSIDVFSSEIDSVILKITSSHDSQALLNFFKGLNHEQFKLIGRLFLMMSAKSFSPNFSSAQRQKKSSWTLFDSNRLMIAVVIVDYFHKYYYIPLSWNLVSIAFKDSLEYFTMPRIKSRFRNSLLIKNNVRYLKLAQKIFAKLRPLCVKAGIFGDIENIIGENKMLRGIPISKENESENSNSRKASNISLNSTIDSEVYDYLNSEKVYEDDSPKDAETCTRLIDIFDETNYFVGILFCLGIPNLMALLGINEDESDYKIEPNNDPEMSSFINPTTKETVYSNNALIKGDYQRRKQKQFIINHSGFK
ncbi:hypothetical protein BB560_000395 [Smittium megazygosporum]|uniref:Uncharacterized protein n=1 Tax=Smittium megazygosporum TaxID=133381 RepID=A0A2T9ZKJ2_9FUNG|nr:hypothetical protein BB560_000395 [Smittium megazygosporum]